MHRIVDGSRSGCKVKVLRLHFRAELPLCVKALARRAREPMEQHARGERNWRAHTY
jgi:hypothetical protein